MVASVLPVTSNPKVLTPLNLKSSTEQDYESRSPPIPRTYLSKIRLSGILPLLSNVGYVF
jgi:hypothetical protein